EVEETTALSLWAGTTGPVTPVRLEAVPGLDDAVVAGLPDDLTPGSTLVMLTDPFTFPAESALAELAAPRVPLIRGPPAAARGASRPGREGGGATGWCSTTAGTRPARSACCSSRTASSCRSCRRGAGRSVSR